ncbi:unnamed protein product [Bathycoccus prasinos]
MFGGHKQQKGGSSYSFSSSNVTIDNKHPVTERADSLSMSGSPPLQRPNFVEEEVVQEEEEDVLVVKMKQKVLLLKQELKAKDDMLEAVQSQAKLDIVNARTRVDSIEEKREELEARCAKAEKLALERTNALETANKKLKEAERSAKVFMQRANAKISEALRENDSTEGPSPSSSSSKVERKMTPSNLSLQEKILRIERQQQMEDEEGLLKKNSNSNTKKKKKNNKEESSSNLVAVNNDDDDEVEEEEEENKEEETKSEKQSVEEVEALRWEIQQLLTQNADAARSFQNSLEIERNKRREAEERAEISEATCVRLQSELKSKESLLKMMEKTSSTSMMRTTFTAALQTRTLNTTEKNKKNQHLVDSKFDDAEEEDSDEDEIPLFSSPPVLKSPIPPLVSRK